MNQPGVQRERIYSASIGERSARVIDKKSIAKKDIHLRSLCKRNLYLLESCWEILLVTI